MIYKGDVPSVPCTTSLDRSTTAGDIDGPSLIFIDFYVPALTPLLHRSEEALHLSENTSFPVVCSICTCIISKENQIELGIRGASCIYELHKIGDMKATCGTAACTSFGVDILPSREALNVLFEENKIGLMSLIKLIEICNFDHLHDNLRSRVLSKAFSISKIREP
jgi:hypothetical protein